MTWKGKLFFGFLGLFFIVWLIADPNGVGHFFSWLINKIEDFIYALIEAVKAM